MKSGGKIKVKTHIANLLPCPYDWENGYGGPSFDKTGVLVVFPVSGGWWTRRLKLKFVVLGELICGVT